MITLQDFITQFKDKTGQGNTPENMGQCVGLVSLWQDNLGVPHEYGNAVDLLNNADTTYFQVIQNTPDNFPVPGDIIVWDNTWGNGAGHTAICVTADNNSFTSFEQNDATGADPNGACEVLSHTDYSGVLGWLHYQNGYPSDNTIPVDQTVYAMLVGKATKYDAFVAAGYNTVGDVNKAIDDLKQQLADKPVVSVSTPPPAVLPTPLPATLPVEQKPNFLQFLANYLKFWKK